MMMMKKKDHIIFSKKDKFVRSYVHSMHSGILIKRNLPKTNKLGDQGQGNELDKNPLQGYCHCFHSKHLIKASPVLNSTSSINSLFSLYLYTK